MVSLLPCPTNEWTPSRECTGKGNTWGINGRFTAAVSAFLSIFRVGDGDGKVEIVEGRKNSRLPPATDELLHEGLSRTQEILKRLLK
jgi:hypothetical protein